MKIINVGYRSVNCYLIITEKAKLLVDVGWPGGMAELKSSMAQQGHQVREVTHVLVTHYHMDHGAIAQEMKDKGAKLVVMENQKTHLNDQRRFIKPPSVYHEIRAEGNLELAFKDSRQFLKTLALDGEIIPTPGMDQTTSRLSLTVASLLRVICRRKTPRHLIRTSYGIGSGSAVWVLGGCIRLMDFLICRFKAVFPYLYGANYKSGHNIVIRYGLGHRSLNCPIGFRATNPSPHNCFKKQKRKRNLLPAF